MTGLKIFSNIYLWNSLKKEDKDVWQQSSPSVWLYVSVDPYICLFHTNTHMCGVYLWFRTPSQDMHLESVGLFEQGFM